MKATVYILLFLIQFLTVSSSKAEARVDERPNIIVFIADDISWDDFGCYGNKIVQTPNIDRIAGEGIKFNNVYLTTSSCSPSRISIMTGRYPHNTRAAELHTEPPIEFPTLASQLKANGYYTAQAGKWHMGSIIKNGFYHIEEDREKNADGGEALWVETVKNRKKNKPFHFWFAAYDAHRAWGLNKFSGTHSPTEIIPPITLANQAKTKIDLAKYYDEIRRFDYYIGKVVEELQEQGILENTVLIIMADNGRPFPRDKTRLYDSGIKTPLIIKWPTGINQQGETSNSLISSIDIAPTILELCKTKIPVSFQGRSFKTILNDTDTPFRKYIFAEHNWHDYEAHERIVRNSDYMYLLNARPQYPNQGPLDVVNSPSFKELVIRKEENTISPEQNDIFLSTRPKEELFDCRQDSLQIHNLIGKKEYILVHEALKKTLRNWMQNTGDDVPENLTKDWYSRTTGAKNTEFHNKRGQMPGASQQAEHINNQLGF